MEDSDSSALYCSQAGVHAYPIHRLWLELIETMTAAGRVYCFLLFLLI